MTAVVVAPELITRMRRSAQESYPEECCGFLFSPAARSNADPRPIVSVAPAPNERTNDRFRRFVISAEGLRQAELVAATRGEAVTGFFHSHPDHPARPSRFDEEHAWPWYSYLILSSTAEGRTTDVGAFELDSERAAFVPVRLLEEASGRPRAAAPSAP